MTTMNTQNNANVAIVIDWDDIDNRIANGDMKISVVAKELGLKQNILKNSLVEHYGNRIVFKRGRNGGVRWAE